MIESNAIISARMRVALSGADEGLPFVSGSALDDDGTGQVPVELLGHLRSWRSSEARTHAHFKKRPSPGSGRRAR
jgi:hypothetical protein